MDKVQQPSNTECYTHRQNPVIECGKFSMRSVVYEGVLQQKVAIL
jgi:hypothetical protein